MSETFKITFIGAGRMASAIVESLLRSKFYTSSEIACCSANDGTGEKLAEKTGIHFVDLQNPINFDTDAILLACKPQQINDLPNWLPARAEGKLVVSILAGTSIRTLDEKIPLTRNHVRVMPNTPGSIGFGMSAFTAQKPLLEGDRKSVIGILDSMGKSIEIEESEMDALTAISGSGPAYLFRFTESLRTAAEELGFSRETADLLARQTIIGSSRLMEESGIDPADLRKQVTSPGGTTQAALESFNESQIDAMVLRAAEAAKKRSIELSQI